MERRVIISFSIGVLTVTDLQNPLDSNGLDGYINGWFLTSVLNYVLRLRVVVLTEGSVLSF